MEKEQIHVLLVEDDEDDYFITKNLLSKANTISCDLHWVHNYSDGLEALVSGSYDVSLVDYRLGEGDGLELLREASEQGATAPMILLTGQGDIEVDLNAMVAGASDYLVKGKIDADVLERSIRYALERHRADERIREQAQLLDKARDAISAYSLNGEVIYWNKSARQLTGWSFNKIKELHVREAFERLYGTNQQLLDEALAEVKQDEEWTGELTLRTRDGNEVPVESRWSLVRNSQGEPSSILVIDTDISERKELERQFLRSQRMESIGRLVGGIAHDLGNLLVPVLLGVEVLEQRFPEDEKARRTLQMIQKSARRGSDMVKQVLSFARGVEGERVPLDLHPIIEEIERMTEETFPHSIELETNLPDDLHQIKGDSTQIQQVLMNLCVNARDAMPEGGRLRIDAAYATLDADSSLLTMDAEAGDYVRITVTDTGEGIEPDEIDKIFEPFYSTKPTGEGTGLGLSSVYSIVKSHGGFVDVSSEVGVGTTFQIYLPVADAQHQEDEDDEVELPRGNGQLLLLVDDEPFVVETTEDMLQRAGYEVLTATGGEEALQVYQEYQNKIEVVITDIAMPKMGGIDLIKKIAAFDSSTPIVAISSPTDNHGRDARSAGADRFLTKPFTAYHLCSCLKEIFQNQASAQIR